MNPSQPTKVLIHGFLQNYRSPWIIEMTHELLAQVMILDSEIYIYCFVNIFLCTENISLLTLVPVF